MYLLLPPVFATIGSIWFWFTDLGIRWKIFASAITAASLGMRCDIPVHFGINPFVPFFMQIFVSLWVVIYLKYWTFRR